MTILIQAKQIGKSFGERKILDGISVEIRNGEKIGLVGANGAGKTTLMKILMGRLSADEGSISPMGPELKIGYLPQSTEYELRMGLLPPDMEGDYLRNASELGLDNKILTHEEKGLSGGERLKISLAKIWSNFPQMLCLDEPTNHLDMTGVAWLVSEVEKFQGAALIISHDRYFLNQTVTKIFDVEDGKLTIYDGSYSAYRLEKQRRMDQQARDYEKQQRKITMIEGQISTLKQWSEKAHRDAGKRDNPGERKQMGLKEYERVKAKKKDNQIKSKTKRLESELQKNKVEKPKEAQEVLFDFENSGKRGKRILEAKGLTKNYGERSIFQPSNFYVMHGEKVGLLGDNGAGKTTFVKMLLGEEDITKGTLWVSSSIKTAYLSQEVIDLPENKSVMEYLDLSGREKVSKARTLFANMGMKEEKLNKPLKVLSLGEKTRVKLVQIIMNNYDVLVLDEPTNHLDLASREQLENTLASFQGTLLVISHDRYFIEKLCDKLLIIENKKIQRVETGLAEYDTKKSKLHEPSKQEAFERLTVIETRMTELLGKITLVRKDSEEYKAIDQELQALMKLKREIG